MKDVKKRMRENVVTYWRLGDDDMEEWHEYEGNDFFVYANFHEREIIKAFKKMCGDRLEES